MIKQLNFFQKKGLETKRERKRDSVKLARKKWASN